MPTHSLPLPDETTRRRLDILVVDDMATNRKLLRATLEAEGHFVLEAADGVEALAVLGRETIDLVITDILMPNMDGFRLCREIRLNAKLCALPILVHTSTYNSPDDMKLAETVGADKYLLKPVPPAVLLRAIGEAMEQRLKAGATAAPGPDEHYVLKQYSAALVNKLEEKNAELQQAVAALQRANDRILDFNKTLERRVQERTARFEMAWRKVEMRNREIESFYHTLSHELKTPLTSAREFIGIVIDGVSGPINEQQAEYLGLARESCDQMRLCLDDLLDSTRLDTGKFALDPKFCSLETLIIRAANVAGLVAVQRQIRLQTNIEPGLPQVCVDGKRMSQVISNLLNNALKFTPDGGQIKISARRSLKAPELFEISVSDTGGGIPADELERIFERLYQVKSGDASSPHGLGLGLYLCRRLVELHGGKIWVESEPGKGSRFTFNAIIAPAQSNNNSAAIAA
jgi:signal transduction histidine kinase